MKRELSELQKIRLSYKPHLPESLRKVTLLDVRFKDKATNDPLINKAFPLTSGKSRVEFVTGSKLKSNPFRVGVLLSGGQAPGGHNVIAGLFDALKEFNKDSSLVGLLGGASGLIEGKAIEIDESVISEFRNLGGFDMIGSGRTKIETEEQFEKAALTVERLNLSGLVIIGGDDSNTNAAHLAEYFEKKQLDCIVTGVPKTIDGDLRGSGIEISFGFDTACKIYSELTGNIAIDTLSAKKSYAFIKLMGRSASHISLQIALATHPNLAFISEEIAADKRSLKSIVDEIVQLIIERAAKGKNYGVILIPEGLVEFIPEMQQLIQELNTLVATVGTDSIVEKLTEPSRKCMESLPDTIRKQLLMDRDPHGNVQVSKIETERLLIDLVKAELKRRKDETVKVKFSPQPFFLGYEGRSGLPTNFDANYCNALGIVAALAIQHRIQGCMSVVSQLKMPVSDWQIALIPLTSMLGLEKRHGELKPVILKALVDLSGEQFNRFKRERSSWRVEDRYLSPGPIQFFGPESITETPYF